MSQPTLFQPLKVGDITLQHRIVMAPLTRFRANKQHVPLPLVKEYYGQRASVPGTLLITEATFISQRAAGYPNAPGIWTREQISAWKQVTDEVHAKGSHIYMQLWALGRVAIPDVANAEGFTIKAPSAIGLDGLAVPEELTPEDIKSLVADHAQAAKNAMEAGFDGVELHGANGYLVDQFIQDTSNQRTDEFGGTIENRSRFPLQVLDALVTAIGSNKVGVRLSPWSDFQGMRMANPVSQFTHLISEAKKLNLAYLHIVEPRISGNADVEASDSNDFAVKAWGKTSPLLIAGAFTPDSAKELIDETHKDSEVAVVFGRYFLANPDLPFRIKKGLELSPYNRDTFYNAEDPVGYIDYPFSQQWQEVRA
jgi:2,4-dienoyl-CoA reductase-like NADH-dependent reductase (Old Yellow Enzyme family)